MEGRPVGSNVVSVSKWGSVTNTQNVLKKFAACDQFIRSRIEPPPVGSFIFHFEEGRVDITGHVTTIRGDECEIVIRNGVPVLHGREDQAVAMYCAIHRELELLKARCLEI